MPARSHLFAALLVVALFLSQYILVTNGFVTGVYNESDTGRLSAWPTLVPVSLNNRPIYALRPLLVVFVYPASVFCHFFFRSASRHPDGLLMSYFTVAMREPKQEHLFLLQLALLNTATWVCLYSLAVSFVRRRVASGKAA
jgi:hypothetical protein